VVPVLAALLLIGGGAAWYFTRTPGPQPPVAGPPAEHPAPPPQPPPPATSSPTTPEPKVAEAEPPKAKVDKKVDKPDKPEKTEKSGGPAKQEAIPAAAAADLAEAEAALTAGKPGEAIRLAQHSLYAGKSSRAYEIMTRARCAQGDLGNAKAALSHVTGRERTAVVRACAKAGVEIH
jgi:outer membrane biosynthesis protein TonB